MTGLFFWCFHVVCRPSLYQALFAFQFKLKMLNVTNFIFNFDKYRGVRITNPQTRKKRITTLHLNRIARRGNAKLMTTKKSLLVKVFKLFTFFKKSHKFRLLQCYHFFQKYNSTRHAVSFWIQAVSSGVSIFPKNYNSTCQAFFLEIMNLYDTLCKRTLR